MVGHNVKKTLLTTVAACAMVMGVGIGSANAFGVEDAWNLNLSVANGVAFDGGGGSFAGLTDQSNIDHGVLQGTSVVTQTVVGFSALGQSFTDNGILGLNSIVEENAIFDTSLNLGTAGALYFEFSGLTGTLNNDTTITFNAGVGSIRLLLDSDLDGDSSTGDILTLASYTLIDPSGGSNLDFHGGTAANSTIDITLVQTSGIANLFTTQGGMEFPLNNIAAQHLGNMGALLDPNFNPNPDNTNIDQFGNGESIIHVQNGGQYFLNTIPEPSSMAAFGFGLIGLMGMTARRRRKTA